MAARCAFCGVLLEGDRCAECGCDRFFIARAGSPAPRAFLFRKTETDEGVRWLIA